jgi:hypothetical protein
MAELATPKLLGPMVGAGADPALNVEGSGFNHNETVSSVALVPPEFTV